MSTPVVPEAYLQLEARLVAYLMSLQQPDARIALDTDLLIYPGHGEQNLDNTPTYSSVFAERSDTQRYWQAGLESVEVRMLIQTQADDTSIEIHNRRVAIYRAAFDLRNFFDQAGEDANGNPIVIPGFRTLINAQPGFGLSGWKPGAPPVEDGFSKELSARQAMFRFTAVCGIELAG